MKALWMTLLLCSCSATIEIKTTDPETGLVEHIKVESARRTAISTGDVTVITGQVLIDDDTVKVLAKEVAPVLNPQKEN